MIWAKIERKIIVLLQILNLKKKKKNGKKMSGILNSTENVPLQQQFEDPLQHIGPLEVDSESKALAKMEEIQRNISSKDDWVVRSNAILEAMCLLKGGVAKYGIDMSSISTGVANCVSDLRSTLVRNGSLFIAACAQTLQNSYITSTDVVIPALSKQLTHGTAIISDSCHLAIIQIATNVQHRKVVRAMQQLANSKSTIQRQVAAEAFQIIVSKWSSKVVSKNMTEIKASLSKLAEDPSQSTRKIAKTALQNMTSGNSSGDFMPNINIKSMSAPLSYQPSVAKPKTAMTPKRMSDAKKDGETGSPKSTRTPTTMRKRPTFRPAQSSMKQSATEDRFQSPKPAHSLSQDIETHPAPMSNDVVFKKSPKRSFMPNLQPPVNEDVMRSQSSQRQRPPQIPPYSQSISRPKKPQINVESDDSDDSTPEPPHHEKNQDLSDYMPPTSFLSTKQFIALLQDIIDTNNYEELSGLEMLLPQSIISGTFYVKSMSEWKKLLKVLYKKYKSDFKEDAKDMIVSFNFDKWIITTNISCYGDNYIFHLFMDDPLSDDNYDFFVSYLNNFSQDNLPDDVLDFVQQMRSQNKDKTGLPNIVRKEPQMDDSDDFEDDFIDEDESTSQSNKIDEDYDFDTTFGKKKSTSRKLGSSLGDVPRGEKLVRECIECIKNGNDFHHYLQKIIDNLKGKNSSTKEYNSSLNNYLPDAFNTQNKNQILEVLDLVISLMDANTTFCLDSILDQVLALCCNQNRTISDRANACLTALSINQEFLLNMISQIPDMNQDGPEEVVALQMILECITDMDSDTLLLFIDVVTPVLELLLKSEVTAHRRTAVAIAAQFQSKVPETFAPFFQNLSPTHQKLIQLRISKSDRPFKY